MRMLSTTPRLCVVETGREIQKDRKKETSKEFIDRIRIYESLDNIRFGTINHLSQNPDIRLYEVGVVGMLVDRKEKSVQSLDHFYLFAEKEDEISRRVDNYLVHAKCKEFLSNPAMLRGMNNIEYKIVSVKQVEPKKPMYH